MQERYGTQCALMADYAVDIADVEVVILYQLSIEALCKLSSGLCDTPYTRLAQRAILSGKRIYVPTQEVELLQNNTMPAAYRAMLQKKLELLEACGLRIARSRHSWTRSCTAAVRPRRLTRRAPAPRLLLDRRSGWRKGSLPNGTS